MHSQTLPEKAANGEDNLSILGFRKIFLEAEEALCLNSHANPKVLLWIWGISGKHRHVKIHPWRLIGLLDGRRESENEITVGSQIMDTLKIGWVENWAVGNKTLLLDIITWGEQLWGDVFKNVSSRILLSLVIFSLQSRAIWRKMWVKSFAAENRIDAGKWHATKAALWQQMWIAWGVQHSHLMLAWIHILTIVNQLTSCPDVDWFLEKKENVEECKVKVLTCLK